ncbi:MAG: TonB-dependent receptor [Bacteroidales bacterium]|nr:TonB-dependent receptor [Bacteroidales bacterium]
MRIIYLILVFIISLGKLYSQNDTIKNNLFSMSLEELLELKISSVSKKPEKLLETPQTVIVITKEEIKRRGYVDLEQLFHDLPGFDISRGNGTHYSQIYQRGYRTKNTEKTVLMIDGVEENDLWSNSVWLSRQYPLSNIERVEIVYGPAATIYGANAFLGVINIVTKTAEQIISKDRKIGLKSQFGYGTWNTRFADLSIAVGTKDVSLILTGRIFNSDEQDLSNYPDWDYDLGAYDINYYKEILGITNDTVAQKAMDLDNAMYYNSSVLNGIKPEYSNQTKDYLFYGKLKIYDFTLGFQSFKRDEGYGAWYRDNFELGPSNGASWIPKNTFFYTKYEKKFSDKLSLTNFSNFKVHQLTGECEELYYKGYFNKEYKLVDIADTTDGNIFLLPVDSIQVPNWTRTWWQTYSQQLRSELRLEYTPHDNFNLITGIEFRVSHIQGAYLFGETENPEETAYLDNSKGGNHYFSRDFGFFMQAGYSPFKNFNFILGGRVDNNKIRLTGGYGTVFNPKAAIVWSPLNFVFKAIYSEAFMDAGYWTKYSTTPGRLLDNPNLKPEKVKNSEYSFSWKANNYFFIDFVAYNSYYTGAIGTVDVSFVDDGGNLVTTTQHQAIGNVNIKGLQSNLYFNYSNYSTYINYTFTKPYNITGKKTRIGDISSHHLNFGINALFFDKLNINLRANWSGKKPTGKETTVSNNPLNKIDAYFVLNNAISYNIYKGISAEILVNNILDTEYFHPGVRSANGIYYASKLPQNRRNITVKINIDF